jgi:predicted phosphate transport protein (TIGR00153 family)
MPKQIDFFKSLDQLNAHLQSIVSLFAEFAEQFNEFENFTKRAKEIEHLGDSQTHEIINKLNQTFITPIDREDIYTLSQQLDDIIDLVENVIHNVKLYGITTKISGLSEFAPLMTEASYEMGKMLGHLKIGKNSKELSDSKIKIHELEDKGDEVFEKCIQNLFASETDAVKIIKTKDILENLEEVMDKFQSVCNIIEGIVVKSS